MTGKQWGKRMVLMEQVFAEYPRLTCKDPQAALLYASGASLNVLVE